MSTSGEKENCSKGRTASMRKVPPVNDVEVLLDKLWWIGTLKNEMPMHMRCYLNEMGLYVQLRRAGGWERLAAGGKYRSYFDAWCRTPSYFDGVRLPPPPAGNRSSWEIRRFDREIWGRRFGHLVWPTYELFLFIAGPMLWDEPVFVRGQELGRLSELSELSDAIFEEVGSLAGVKIMEAVRGFRATGEWVGLLEWQCKACGERLHIWEVQGELCPRCGGYVRQP